MKSEDQEEEKDVFREIPIRYLGYANEVGEAFRAQVHVNWVRLSYGIASAYVIADAVHKGNIAAKKRWKDDQIRKSKITWTVIDTLSWQGLASVVIPGFTINRICALTAFLLRKSTISAAWTVASRNRFTTFVGLGCIPLIIKPIDRSVDWFMEATLRKWYHIGPVMESLVHHDRND